MSLELNDNLKDFAKDSLVRKALQEIQSASSGGGYSYAEVELTPAQIRGLGTTPVSLLPAPGAGSYYYIDKMIFEFVYSNGFAYNDMAGDYLEIRYTEFGEKTLATINGSLISSASAKVAVVKEFITVETINLMPAPLINPYAINKEIHLGTYNYTDLMDNSQTATLKIKIWYNIINLG